jgi:ribosomal protein S18 acetylase RimI-like enzyme
MISIRLATAADVPTIVKLNDALFHEDAALHDPAMNLDWAREHGSAYFSRYFEAPTSIVYLAESDGSPVGYLAGYVKPPNDYRPIRSAELESIYILPDFRSGGVGKQLTQQFLSWCRSQGAVRISVTAYSDNENAVAFYRRLGFTDKHTTLELNLK